MDSTIDLRESTQAARSLRRRGSGLQPAPPRNHLDAPTSERRYRVGWRTYSIDLCAVAIALAATTMLVGFSYWYLIVLAAWPFALASVGATDLRGIVRGTWSTSRVWAAMAKVVVPLAFTGLFLPAAAVGHASLFAAILALATAIGRRGLVSWVARRHRAGELKVPILVRGQAGEVLQFVDLLDRAPSHPFRVAGVQITDAADDLVAFPAPKLPAGEDPLECAARHGMQVVAFAGQQPEDSSQLRRLLWRMESEGVDARMVPVVAPLAPPEVDALGATGLPTLSFRGRDLRAETGFIKSVGDKVVAAGALVALAPLLAVVALAVKLSSPGPVLFCQTRVGRGRATFSMYKFRTMVVDAQDRIGEVADQNHHSGGTLFKVRRDPRVTKVGAFLRRYSLDELPQLFNVLRGDMSLVGPRPPLPQEVANYQVDAHRRFQVRPGLTGLWQVSGRSDLDPVESARLDTHYVEHWSPAMDLWILMSTARAVLSGQGAY